MDTESTESTHFVDSSSKPESSAVPGVSFQNSLKECEGAKSSISDEYDSDSDDEPYIAPPHLVQITATKSEVTKMINSFIAGRRARVNQQNIREFCGPDYDGQSCARVRAVHFTKRLVQVEDAEKYWARFMKK